MRPVRPTKIAMPHSGFLANLGRRLAVFAGIALLAAASTASRADTVASLLGDFTINQFCGIRLDERTVEVRYTVVFGQLPALRELHLADTDGDGVTSESERNAYAQQLAPEIARQLALTVDGAAVPLAPVRWTTSLPTEQGGFSLRIDIDLAGAPQLTDAQTHRLEFVNGNYAGRFGWREIVLEPSRSLAVFDTNAFSTSLTAGLAEAVRSLPATGPLDERSVRASVRRGSTPPGSASLQPRLGTSAPSDAGPAAPRDGTTPWIKRETRRLIDLISAPTVPLHVLVLALLGAMVLGALHSFSPGHGKTVVGAYLIGSRATARHAVFLGATVTVTHTLGVFALGFATLFASRFVVPERLFPILSLTSGFLVVAMGAALLMQRWRGARDAIGASNRRRYRPVDRTTVAQPGRFGYPAHGQALAYAPLRAHPHGSGPMHAHADGSMHSHYDGITHSHGGSVHMHLPPGADGERVTWRSLLALGVSGGLVPCPSAMVLLLAAVALNKVGYGLLLVLALSVGLAATLSAVGLFFLYGRNRIGKRRTGVRWLQWMPIASAAAITLVGAMMCYGTVASWPS